MILPLAAAVDWISPTLLLVVYCLLILLASLSGGLIPLLVTLTHRTMQLAVSFVAGVMLGVGVLHLLAHALREAEHEGGTIEGVLLWTLAGLLLMFFIERFFSYHQHDVPVENHDHGHNHGPEGKGLSWGGAALGLTLHSIINGVALGAKVQAEWGHAAATLAGLGTFLVIFLHKPFDSLTIATLMAKGGWSPLWRHLVNGLFALAIPVGALAFYLGVDAATAEGSLFVIYALAFSAGAFLCISLSDLLPELQFHHHDRGKLSLCLLAGLALAYVVGTFESHGHGHPDASPGIHQGAHDHDHS